MVHSWFAAMIAACGGMDGTVETGSSVGLPPEETGGDLGGDTGFTVFPVEDTAGSVGNPEPAHLLTVQHEGTWVLSPPGGPYTTMTGTMRVRERIDGDFDLDTGDTADTAGSDDTGLVDPECDVTWTLTGATAEIGCPSCSFTFEVVHEQTAGDPSACLDPELFADGASATMGYDPDVGSVNLDMADTGVWLPWYVATLEGDVLILTYAATTGVAVEEEDE